MRRTFAGCLPLVVAVGLPAQTTHLVGPGGLPQIRNALANAAPGDLIHVQPGTYAQFDANVGVTIRALVPGTVTIAYDIAFAPAGCSANPFCGVIEGPGGQPSARGSSSAGCVQPATRPRSCCACRHAEVNRHPTPRDPMQPCYAG